MSGPAGQRLLTREQLDAAAEAWAAWDAENRSMVEEWAPWRKLAASAGIVGPPEGSRWDSWEDDDPSQLAILTRAIRETPELLREALMAPRVHSWASAILVLLRARDELAAKVEERNRLEAEAWERTKAEERAAAAGALERLGWPTGRPR